MSTPIVNLSLPVAGARQGGCHSAAAAASARLEQRSVKQHKSAARWAVHASSVFTLGTMRKAIAWGNARLTSDLALLFFSGSHD